MITKKMIVKDDDEENDVDDDISMTIRMNSKAKEIFWSKGIKYPE